MTLRKSKKTTLEKVGVNIDDASITAPVKLALLFHRSTSVMKTKVDTKNGVIAVSGADNNAEKDFHYYNIHILTDYVATAILYVSLSST